MTSPNFWAEFTVTDAKFRRPPSKVSLVRVTPRVTVNCPELDSLIGTELAPRAEPNGRRATFSCSDTPSAADTLLARTATTRLLTHRNSTCRGSGRPEESDPVHRRGLARGGRTVRGFF